MEICLACCLVWKAVLRVSTPGEMEDKASAGRAGAGRAPLREAQLLLFNPPTEWSRRRTPEAPEPPGAEDPASPRRPGERRPAAPAFQLAAAAGLEFGKSCRDYTQVESRMAPSRLI